MILLIYTCQKQSERSSKYTFKNSFNYDQKIKIKRYAVFKEWEKKWNFDFNNKILPFEFFFKDL